MSSRSQAYDAAYFAVRERSPTFGLELDAIRRVLIRCGVLNGRILELGAGSGALARYCGSRAKRWVAADQDLRHFSAAPQLFPVIKAVQCDALRLPLGASTFDAVVAQHVIEHFQQPARVLQEWARVLRGGGICVLVTPNKRFPLRSWFDDPTHRNLFDGAELKALMGGAGFTRVSVRPLVPWLGSERLVYLSARIQHRISPLFDRAWEPSLSLLAVGAMPLARSV